MKLGLAFLTSPARRAVGLADHLTDQPWQAGVLYVSTHPERLDLRAGAKGIESLFGVRDQDATPFGGSG